MVDRSITNAEIKENKMDLSNCQHNFDEWRKMSLYLQLGNLGSEVHRSLKWYGKNEKRFQVSFDRALELFDFTMECLKESPARLGEVCRAREEFCDYFMGNSWGTDPEKMMRYYDQFAIRGRELES